MRRSVVRILPGVVALSAVLLVGCFAPATRPVVDFVWCSDGSSGELKY